MILHDGFRVVELVEFELPMRVFALVDPDIQKCCLRLRNDDRTQNECANYAEAEAMCNEVLIMPTG